jgi:hypothetical protein
VVYFLIDNFGKERLLDFCAKLKESGSFMKSLRSAYGFATLDALDTAYLAYLERGR